MGNFSDYCLDMGTSVSAFLPILILNGKEANTVTAFLSNICLPSYYLLDFTINKLLSLPNIEINFSIAISVEIFSVVTIFMLKKLFCMQD